jgi:hypothetical protein
MKEQKQQKEFICYILYCFFLFLLCMCEYEFAHHLVNVTLETIFIFS